MEFCSGCGEKAQPEWDFCPFCSTHLGTSEKLQISDSVVMGNVNIGSSDGGRLKCSSCKVMGQTPLYECGLCDAVICGNCRGMDLSFIISNIDPRKYCKQCFQVKKEDYISKGYKNCPRCKHVGLLSGNMTSYGPVCEWCRSPLP